MRDKAPIAHNPRWPVVSLREVTSKIGSGATPRGGAENYLDSRVGFALVRSQNVFDRYFAEDGLAFITDEQAHGLRSVVLQPNDILLNITGDGVTFGRACLVPGDLLPACVNQHVSIVRVDPTVADAGYILSFLTHPDVKPYIESFNAGGSRRAITKGHIESFQIPLPPLAEQRAIASILGALDDKIDLNRRMNETLEELARTIFKAWFVDFDPVRAKAEGRQPVGMDAETAALFPSRFVESELGEIPEGWLPATVEQATSMIIDHRGKTPMKLGGAWSDIGIPAVSAKNVKGGRIVRSETIRFVDEALYARWMKDELAAGDVLLTSEGPLGELCYLSTAKRFCLSQRLFALRATPGRCAPSFLYLWLRGDRAQTEMRARATGTTVLGIRQAELRKLAVLLCPGDLMAGFHSSVQPLLTKVESNEVESSTLTELRDLLLPKLISGELRVSDAEKLAEAVL